MVGVPYIYEFKLDLEKKNKRDCRITLASQVNYIYDGKFFLFHQGLNSKCTII